MPSRVGNYGGPTNGIDIALGLSAAAAAAFLAYGVFNGRKRPR